MKEKYTRPKAPLHREVDHPKAWYRTLFVSYLHKPPPWVYALELVVALLAVFVLLEHDDEVLSLLIHLLSEKGP